MKILDVQQRLFKGGKKIHRHILLSGGTDKQAALESNKHARGRFTDVYDRLCAAQVLLNMVTKCS